MSEDIKRQLDRLVEETITLSNERQRPLTIDFDSDWPSPCYQEVAEQGTAVPWKPVYQHDECDFSQLEEALELKLNPEFCSYFTRYYSDNLLTLAPDGGCELLQVWNADDFRRLQENLIGHVLMKRRLNQPVTLFFALTDEEDFMLSVDNENGNVVLEPVGKPATRIIAPSLADFISTLKPTEQQRD